MVLEMQGDARGRVVDQGRTGLGWSTWPLLSSNWTARNPEDARLQVFITVLIALGTEFEGL